jgi:hypothetical protein
MFSDWPTVGPIKRSSDRSLHITQASSNIIVSESCHVKAKFVCIVTLYQFIMNTYVYTNIIVCLPFKRPKERVEPVHLCICPIIFLSGKQCRNIKLSLSIIETSFTEYFRKSYLKSACHRPAYNFVLDRLFSPDI